MQTNDKKLYYSYRESKNTIFTDKQEKPNEFIKRSEKRHKTQTGILPKNFQFIIKSKIKNEKEEEKKINDKKYDSQTFNISNLSGASKLRKNNSTLILPSINKYNLNNNSNIFEKKINNNINNNNIYYSSSTTIPQKKTNPIKKSKTQIVSRSNLINNNRHNPNFPKYERRMSDKFITIQPKKTESPKPKEKNETIIPKDENRVKISSTRRRSLGGGIRRFVKKESEVKKEFKNITYVKISKATSEAGLDDGVKKINQDVYIHEKNINGILNFNIFGVLDGHGDYGHLASNFTKRYIINRISNHPKIKNLKNNKEIYNELIKNKYQLITNIFLDADTQIKKEKFDCEMSGTTCVIVIQLDENLICANTGDSRAILVYDESQNNLKNTKVFPLSHDAKPDLPREKERIIKCGGEVEKMVDEKGLGVGPFRVWAKGKSYPGLAMSRSIGDMDAKLVGVIPNPEFIEYKIDSKAKYMIICSDGIWEFLSNEEVMKIANSFYLRNDPFGLCQNLTNKSMDFWLKDDNYVDDITVVAVFF